MEHFQKEMQDLKKRSAASFEQVGTRDEMAAMQKDTSEIADFCKEIKQHTKVRIMKRAFHFPFLI